MLSNSFVRSLQIHPPRFKIILPPSRILPKSYQNQSSPSSEFTQIPSKSFFCPLPYYRILSKFNRPHPVDSLESFQIQSSPSCRFTGIVPKSFCFLPYHQNPSKLPILQVPKIHQNHSLAFSAFIKILPKSFVSSLRIRPKSIKIICLHLPHSQKSVKYIQIFPSKLSKSPPKLRIFHFQCLTLPQFPAKNDQISFSKSHIAPIFLQKWSNFIFKVAYCPNFPSKLRIFHFQSLTLPQFPAKNDQISFSKSHIAPIFL